MSGDSRQPSGAVLQERMEKTKTPRMYSVVLLNDDYTTMEFVVAVLEKVFQKSPAEAFRLMMQVHTQGRAVCGTYTYEVAETKADTVHDLASREGFPLQASLEEE
jgi:ATP-dependent Clp protease adaptor protein ClpS